MLINFYTKIKFILPFNVGNKSDPDWWFRGDRDEDAPLFLWTSMDHKVQQFGVPEKKQPFLHENQA